MIDFYYPHNVTPGMTTLGRDAQPVTVIDSHYNYSRDGWVIVGEDGPIEYGLTEYVPVII